MGLENAKIIAVRTNKTIYRDGDKTIKLFDENYSKSDILNEALNHARVEETGLSVPKLLDVGMVDGKWAITMEYIPGKTLAQLMEENPDRFDAYLEQLVDIQMMIHRQSAPLLGRLSDKMQRKISQTTLDATTRYDLHMRLEALPRHSKVCHGDFNATNVILTENGTPYIIDWAHATQGNASADAARTYLLYRLAGENEHAEQYLELFCRKSDTARQYVDKWIPIVAASQSVKGKPEEREMLLSFVSVVDYQ
jgi:tRNA A-37 threonylcarbamoyl transferase component Bud32